MQKKKNIQSKWFGGKPKGSIIEYKVDINVDIDNVANIDIDNNDDNNDNDINDDINDVGSNDSDSVKNDIDDDIDDDRATKFKKKSSDILLLQKTIKEKKNASIYILNILVIIQNIRTMKLNDIYYIELKNLIE